MKAIFFRGLIGFVSIGCVGYPLLLFLRLLPLSTYEHSSDHFDVLRIVVLGAFGAAATYLLAIGHELNRARLDWRHDVMHVAIPCVMMALLIGFLGCSWRLQDRVMEVAAVRIPHATLLLKEPGCEPLRLAGLVESPALATASVAARPVADAASHALQGCVLRDVTVLSNTGTRWPTACVDSDGEITGIRIAVRAEDVADTLAGDTARVNPQQGSVVSLCGPVSRSALVAAPASGAASGFGNKRGAKHDVS